MIFKHLAGLQIKATFSDCGKFRYKLQITQPERGSGKVLCVIMQNPSEADSVRADKSVQFLEKLIFQGEYLEFADVSELIIVNQFAYIQKKDFEGSDRAIGPDNDTYIRDSIQKAEIVLLAWGKKNSYLARQEAIITMLRAAGNKQLYKTKKHPSRGHYLDFIEAYEISQLVSH